MAWSYVFLLSSLPMLHIGAKPPFSFERFLALCHSQAPEADFAVLEAVGRGAWESALAEPLIRRWVDFDTALRNELVRGRGARLGVEPSLYLRGEAAYPGAWVAHGVQAALRHPSPLEGERMLDEMRWHFLEEEAAGRYFDLDRLIVYALELMILLRWERISGADKPRLLQEATIHT